MSIVCVYTENVLNSRLILVNLVGLDVMQALITPMFDSRNFCSIYESSDNISLKMLLFEWDHQKAERNATKHRVTFQEAATVFADSLSVTFPDPDHSLDEERFITVGTSETGKVLIVAHTDRGDRIRIISARRTTRREKEFYEEGKE